MKNWEDYDRRVILETIEEFGTKYRVIGAVYNKNKELIHAHDIVQSVSLERALDIFYRVNPDWTGVEVKDNTK